MNLLLLGTMYEYQEDDLRNEDLIGLDGMCEIYDKRIIVRDIDCISGNTEKSKRYRQDHVRRHELIHALSEESGASYGENEELVDWIASMIPRVNRAMEAIKDEFDE